LSFPRKRESRLLYGLSLEPGIGDAFAGMPKYSTRPKGPQKPSESEAQMPRRVVEPLGSFAFPAEKGSHRTFEALKKKHPDLAGGDAQKLGLYSIGRLGKSLCRLF